MDAHNYDFHAQMFDALSHPPFLQGDIVWEVPFKELFQVVQRPMAPLSDENALTLIEGKIDKTGVSSVSHLVDGGAKKLSSGGGGGAYVPPHLRNKPTANGVPGATATTPSANTAPPAGGLVPKKAIGTAAAAATVADGRKTELEKKKLGVARKLRQLEQLKEKQAGGAVLEANQLEKLATEVKLRAEMEELEKAMASMG